MRLTKDIKEKIIANVLKTLDARKEKLMDEGKALAELIYNTLVPPEMQAIMAQLPTEYFYTSNIINVCLNGEYARFDLEGRCVRSHLQFDAPKLLPQSMLSLVHISEKEHQEAYTAAKHYEQWCKRFRIDYLKLRSLTENMVNSVTTDKRLVEIWPEATKYIPPMESAPSDNPLMVLPNQINDMITCAAEGTC